MTAPNPHDPPGLRPGAPDGAKAPDVPDPTRASAPVSATKATYDDRLAARDVIARTRRFVVENRGRSWWYLGSTLIAIVAAAVATCALDWTMLRIASSVLLGLLLVRMFVIYHDVQHGAILAGSRFAATLMRGFGLAVLNPRSIWSRSHNHHHRTVGQTFGSSIGSFPLMTRTAWQVAGAGRRLTYVAQRHVLTIVFGYATIFLYGMCIRAFVTDRRRHLDAGAAVVLHAAVIATLAVFAPTAMLFVVLVPMTVACALGAYLFYAQHNFPSVQIMDRGSWSYADAALTSSSYMHMGPIMRWFTGNIGFHHVHHLNPRIPFYRLPEAMRAIVELQTPGTTSLHPLQVWKCLRLRLWCAESGRMVRR